jgi:hypothetical protein
VLLGPPEGETFYFVNSRLLGSTRRRAEARKVQKNPYQLEFLMIFFSFSFRLRYLCPLAPGADRRGSQPGGMAAGNNTMLPLSAPQRKREVLEICTEVTVCPANPGLACGNTWLS